MSEGSVWLDQYHESSAILGRGSRVQWLWNGTSPQQAEAMRITRFPHRLPISSKLLAAGAAVFLTVGFAPAPDGSIGPAVAFARAGCEWKKGMKEAPFC
jgi:hypothetical protein